MLYEENLKQTMLDVLENRMSGIANIVVLLYEQGYVPNRIKFIIMNWSKVLFDAYENSDIFSEEQIRKLDILYNKVLKL